MMYICNIKADHAAGAIVASNRPAYFCFREHALGRKLFVKRTGVRVTQSNGVPAMQEADRTSVRSISWLICVEKIRCILYFLHT
jgi:hypothetical protein